MCGSWWLLKTWSRTVGREDKIIPIIKRHSLQLLRRDSRRVPVALSVPLLSTLLPLSVVFLTADGRFGQFVNVRQINEVIVNEYRY